LKNIPSLEIERKFIESHQVEDYEIWTDTGWSDIAAIGKTIPYQVYELKTENHSLKCADDHIVFNSYMEECYVKELVCDDVIMTESGRDLVNSVTDLDYQENMYDLQLNDINHRYYTNGILSHNSLWLCDLAAEAVKNGTNVIYYTFELSEKKVMARIGSNLLNIPIRDYYKLTQDKVALKNRMASLEMQNMKTPGRLIIKEFPTGGSSVQDMESHANKLQEQTGQDFPLVIIDYINIVKNWRNPNSENMYLKIKQLSEDIRGWMVRTNKCCVTATQTNRGAIGSTDFNSGAIAESAGLAHTVDGMFGVIQDEIMYANREYFLKTLLNRNEGFKNSKKRFAVNYEFMRIIEDLDSQIIDA
jgi:hypothetical protein